MSEIIRTENGKVTLDLHISPEDYVKALESAYRRLGGRYNIPGFRNGKAPRKVIEKSYGLDVFWDREFDALVQKAYSDAISEHNLEPELQPELMFTEVSEDGVVSFTAAVVLRPVVKLGQYKGIEVEKIEYNVTDEDVENEITKKRRETARMINVERPVEDGDEVKLDFAGFLGDEQFDGGTAENYTLKIGSKTFIPGFEEQMIGMTIGETRDLNITFPADYQEEKLAGKDVIFKVTVHEISVEELPEFDDEFVQDTSEFTTVAEYTAAIRADLEEKAAVRAKEELENKLMLAAIGNAEIELHEDLVKYEVEGRLENFEKSLKGMGIDIDQYCEYFNISKETMRSQYEEAAKRDLKAQYVLIAISEAENITVDDDNYRDAIRSSSECKRNHWDDAKIDEELSKKTGEYAFAALYDATLKLLMKDAVIK